MMGMIKDLLFRPDVFFADRMKWEENLKIPGLIVVIGGVISAAAAYVVSEPTNRILGQIPEVTGLSSALGVIEAIFAFIVFIILYWLIFGGIFYGISIVFSGKGGFKRILEYVGFGLVPVIIGSVISFLIALYYIPMVEIPVISSVSDPMAIQRAITQLMQDPAFSSYRIISSIISVIFLSWSANLWIFGMKHARNLTTKHAVITVLIPVVIYIVIILYMAFAGFPVPGGA
jgi:hypothetical protein